MPWPGINWRAGIRGGVGDALIGGIVRLQGSLDQRLNAIEDLRRDVRIRFATALDLGCRYAADRDRSGLPKIPARNICFRDFHSACHSYLPDLTDPHGPEA